LLYIDRNAIHAFHLKENCDNSKKYAMVSIWARSTAHDKNNDKRVSTFCTNDKDANFDKFALNKEGLSFKCKLCK